MPDAPLTPDKRRIELDPDLIDPPPRAPFVELGLVSNFSFLQGASDAVDLVLTARASGYDAIGVADVNSMAGVVRIHSEARTLKLRPVIGARIETTEGLAFLAYPTTRAAYGRLTRLISAGRMATLDGGWQAKGECDITLAMLAEHCAAPAIGEAGSRGGGGGKGKGSRTQSDKGKDANLDADQGQGDREDPAEEGLDAPSDRLADARTSEAGSVGEEDSTAADGRAHARVDGGGSIAAARTKRDQEVGKVHLVLLPPEDLEARFTITVPNNVIALRGARSSQSRPVRRDRGRSCEERTQPALVSPEGAEIIELRQGRPDPSDTGHSLPAGAPKAPRTKDRTSSCSSADLRNMVGEPVNADPASPLHIASSAGSGTSAYDLPFPGPIGSAHNRLGALGKQSSRELSRTDERFSRQEDSPGPEIPAERQITAPFADLITHLADQLPTLTHLAASYLYRGNDIARIDRLDTLARTNSLTLLATNDVHYHAPDRRPLQDVMTAIRHKTTVARAGHLLRANAERHLKSPAEMLRLFTRWPHAITASRAFADACTFSLDQLRYEYPTEILPNGKQPQDFLVEETHKGAKWRYPNGLPASVEETLERELELIAKLDLARYFLTIKDIVDYARSVEPPILCQGRGSAANSAVCYCLGITSVDPAKHALLFDRFISEERREPPDIDVDFEHERREEVIQYIYRKYGRHRAGLCATVIHYRPRMAIREVGKAMGLTEDVTSALARTVWGGWGKEIGEAHVAETGMDVTDPHLVRVLKLTQQMIGMPRHLSQHVGGFILTDGPLTETVPIGNGAMPERSFIEWDKDDIDALGILKVDVLALGMLTCIKKCLDLLENHHHRVLTLASVPREDPETYAMLRKGDSLGVFQVESRAQMNMLPRLRPREFYDLVIQVAIVRPGPIQGDMVHPYLKRRRGEEQVAIPAPGPEHGPPDELSSILGRTLGVPIFQEQAMKIALDAAKFSSIEANRLRKAMATFRSRGMVDELQDMMVERMVARGYDRDFAQRCFNQIRGFGEYGFPESHAASFAHLVYISSWLKCHFPAAFGCALLNSQPMGFYAPAQIVRDAVEHGVKVLPADVNCSQWDCTLEDLRDQSSFPSGGGGRRAAPYGGGFPGGTTGAAGSLRQPCKREDRGRLDTHIALRIGLRQIDGLPEHVAARLIAERAVHGPFADVGALRDRAGLSPAHIERLASADCFGLLGLTRRQALWDVRSLIAVPDLPLFQAAATREEGAERARTRLPTMPLCEEVVADYQTTRLSLKAHPLAFLRASLAERGFVRAADLRWRKLRSMVQVAGVVLIRQRPGSAKGVCFITLEDETGVINLVVWPHLKERYRKVVMGARLMEVRGRVEYDDEVIHVIAAHMVDATDQLQLLSDDLLKAPVARADHVNNPLPTKFGPRDELREGADDPYGKREPIEPLPIDPWQPPPAGNRECGFISPGHPRDARIISKSRDFH